mgnify:CR=1 FL=1
MTTLGQPNPKGSLTIFDRFVTDKELPKHKKVVQPNPSGLGESNIAFTSGSVSWPGEMSVNPWEDRKTPKVPWWKKWWPWGRPLPPVPVETVFKLVLDNNEQLTEFQDREALLDKMLVSAKKAGQTSLVRDLEEQRGVRRFENVLFAKGRKRVLTEAQLIKFVAKCERGLCLDWIADFVRPIPSEVLAEKEACDKDELFDNYVVLHFDPNNKGTAKKDRDKEERRVKDPILFGVLQGSRKLYFVGDWQDELCNLTLQQIVDKLGVPLEMK